MARLCTNENFPQPAVEELRRLGHGVLTTHEAGESGSSAAFAFRTTAIPLKTKLPVPYQKRS